MSWQNALPPLPSGFQYADEVRPPVDYLHPKIHYDPPTEKWKVEYTNSLYIITRCEE